MGAGAIRRRQRSSTLTEFGHELTKTLVLPSSSNGGKWWTARALRWLQRQAAGGRRQSRHRLLMVIGLIWLPFAMVSQGKADLDNTLHYYARAMTDDVS